MGTFNQKDFNDKAFNYAVGHVPNLVKNEIFNSRAVVRNNSYTATMNAQSGINYQETAIKGLLDGEAVNYDGKTDITATSTKTFTKGVQVIGRAKAWLETDFADDITGQDFMDNVVSQVGTYWTTEKQKNLIAVLKGVFNMGTSKANKTFVSRHTTNVNGEIQPTTLNSAVTKACGDNKNNFSLVIMHSDVATQLENQNLLKFKTYTDPNGLTSELPIATWSGKTVLIDDDVPVEVSYELTKDTELDGTKVYYTKATTGDVYNEVDEPDVKNIGTYYEAKNEYTTYVLGNGAIEYDEPGAKVPSEMSRDPKTNGGQTTLYTRDRFLFSPKGISYEKKAQASASPTLEELENGENWAIAHSNETVAANRSYINHKAILIVRILSK